MTPAQRGILVAAAVAVVAPITMKWEGKENIGYADKLAGGKPTACYGSTKNVVVGKYYSDAECKRRFVEDAESHGLEVSKCLPDWTLYKTNYLGAMIDMGFNIGSPKFCTSGMVRKARAGDLKGSCDYILKYTFVGGMNCANPANRCMGIPLRRKEIHALCLSGL